MHDSFTRQQDGQRPIILFTNLPPLDQLFAVTVRITNSSFAQSANRFQPQIIKCREFIFTEPDVIGTPSADISDNCFYLISQASVIKSGRIQARISKVGLQVSKPYQATPDLYQSCLKYTLQARISPNWNKVGQWFLQGRDFLTLSGCLNGIKMDLTMNQSELFFTLEATAFKTAPLKVDDLDIIDSKLKAFLTDSTAQINHHEIGSDWCFIMPSMKKGRIRSITHEVPEACPLMTYRDLKRHWKNMYGYRLPEEETGINYYQISFGNIGGKLFTYPELCLRGRDLQRISRVDPKPIMRAFMQEIQTKFPTVCGFPFKLQSKAKFTSVDFQTGLEATPQAPANLTNKTSNTRPQLYRSKSDMDRLMNTNIHINPAEHKHTTSGNQTPSNTVVGMNSNVQHRSAEHKQTSIVNTALPNRVVQNKTAGNLSRNILIPSENGHITQQTCEQTPPIQMAIQPCYNSNVVNIQSSNVTAETPSNNNSIVNHQENPSVRKLFPKFNVKKSLFKGSSSTDQSKIPKFVPQFVSSQRPFAVVSATKKATSAELHTPTPDIDKKAGVRFSDITSVKTFGTSPVTLVAPNGDQSGSKVTPRFFQKKPKSTTILPNTPSSIVKSKPAIRDGEPETKQKSGKRTKTPKDGSKEGKKRKLKKAED